MARPKSPLNLAAEQYDCPACAAQPKEACINTVTGKVVPTHQKRRNAVCQETFMNMPAIVITSDGADGHDEWPMFCGKLAGHRAQHQTPDKRLTWAKGFGGDHSLESLLESA